METIDHPELIDIKRAFKDVLLKNATDGQLVQSTCQSCCYDMIDCYTYPYPLISLTPQFRIGPIENALSRN